jgi:hypothetical protein
MTHELLNQSLTGALAELTVVTEEINDAGYLTMDLATITAATLSQNIPKMQHKAIALDEALDEVKQVKIKLENLALSSRATAGQITAITTFVAPVEDRLRAGRILKR